MKQYIEDYENRKPSSTNVPLSQQDNTKFEMAYDAESDEVSVEKQLESIRQPKQKRRSTSRANESHQPGQRRSPRIQVHEFKINSEIIQTPHLQYDVDNNQQICEPPHRRHHLILIPYDSDYSNEPLLQEEQQDLLSEMMMGRFLSSSSDDDRNKASLGDHPLQKLDFYDCKEDAIFENVESNSNSCNENLQRIDVPNAKNGGDTNDLLQNLIFSFKDVSDKTECGSKWVGTEPQAANYSDSDGLYTGVATSFTMPLECLGRCGGLDYELISRLASSTNDYYKIICALS